MKDVYIYIEKLKKKDKKIYKFKKRLLNLFSKNKYIFGNQSIPANLTVKNCVDKINAVCSYANISINDYWEIIDNQNDFTNSFVEFKQPQDFYSSLGIRNTCLNVFNQVTLYPEIYSYIYENFKDNKIKYCDFGCGSATMSLFLCENMDFEIAHLYDIKNASAEYIKNYIKNHNLKNTEWKNVLKDLPNNYYDIIVCNDVLEHLAKATKVLKTIYKMLKPNGLLLLQDPFEANNIPEHIEGAARDFYFHGGYEFLNKNFKKIIWLNKNLHISAVYKKYK